MKRENGSIITEKQNIDKLREFLLMTEWTQSEPSSSIALIVNNQSNQLEQQLIKWGFVYSPKFEFNNFENWFLYRNKVFGGKQMSKNVWLGFPQLWVRMPPLWLWTPQFVSYMLVQKIHKNKGAREKKWEYWYSHQINLKHELVELNWS